jgi:ankyrin repeat protein
MTTPTNITLAELAYRGKLTIEQVNDATKYMLHERETCAGYSALYWACGQCGSEVIEAILDKGVNIDGFSAFNFTPLMRAAESKRWDIVKLLLQRGGNAQLLNRGKKNVLHYAAQAGAPDEIIKILIDAGADPRAEDDQRNTPVDYARQEKHESSAEFIEQYSNVGMKSANLMV